MIKALLVTPLPPQPTGLADFARRILSLTENHVEWTVAYPSGAQPLDGFDCLPISELKNQHFEGAVIYQIGNSPHCEEVIETLLSHGGTGLFHETNMHHVLRNKADKSGHWETYKNHVNHDYKEKSESFLAIMNKKAKSLAEYDNRLRVNQLVGNLVSSCDQIAVLSDTAKLDLAKLSNGKSIVRMGFLPDFLGKVKRTPSTDKIFTVGIVGTYHFGRSWPDMLKAVQMFRRIVDCRLLIIGSGWPETDYSWIKATGRLPDIEFRQELENIDIAIDLRRHTCGETSASMMDLLRRGIPAIVTSEGTFRDISADAVLRIPSESGAGGAYAALKYLYQNHQVRSSISTVAAQYFNDVSDKKKCLAEWLDLIERSGS